MNFDKPSENKINKVEIEGNEFEVIDVSKEIPPEVFNKQGDSKYLEKRNQILNNFMNKITDGKYMDSRFLKHTVGAYRERKDVNRYHEGIDYSGIFNEDIHDGVLYFNTTNPYWFDRNPSNKLIISSSDNEKFAKMLASILITEDDNDIIKIHELPNLEIKTIKDCLNKKVNKGFLDDWGNDYGEGERYSSLKKDEEWEIDGPEYDEFPNHEKNRQRTIVTVTAILLNKKIHESMGQVSGVGINFFSAAKKILKKEYGISNIKFEDIADIIVDLPKGKVYKRAL